MKWQMSCSRYVFTVCNYVLLIHVIKRYYCRLLWVYGRAWLIDNFWIVLPGNVRIEFSHFPSTPWVPQSKYCWRTCLSNISLETQMLLGKKYILPITHKLLLLCKPLSIPSSPTPSPPAFSSSLSLLPEKLSSWQVTFKVTQWLLSHSSLKSYTVEFVRRKTTLLNCCNKKSSPDLKFAT